MTAEQASTAADEVRALLAQLVLDCVLQADREDGEAGIAVILLERAKSLQRAAGAGGLPETARAAGLLASSSGAEARERFEARLADVERTLEREIAGVESNGSPANAAEASSAQGSSVQLGDDPELVSDFVVESGEHLSNIEAQLLLLEQNPQLQEAIHSVFRGFHTIKGLAGFLGLGVMQEVAHEVETLLDLARNGELSLEPVAIDVILGASDHLGQWLRALEDKVAGRPFAAPARADGLLDRIRSARGRQKVAAEDGSPPPSIDPETPDTGAELEVLVRAVESASSLPVGDPGAGPDAAPDFPAVEPGVATGAVPDLPAVEPGPGKVADATARSASARSEARTVKVDTAKLDYLVDMVGEMVIAQSLVQHDPDLGAEKRPRLAHNLAQLARITGDVQKTAMSMRMVPVGLLFQKMHRLVRDLTRKAGKQAELEIGGGNTELDRNIVEQLADPLMHMVRNSIDHGVESPAERIGAGKNPVARVGLRASHQAGHIIIEVADDGRGLDCERILSKARAQGLVAADQELTEAEVFSLIFQPGFSTATQVTDVSGRGVGMDVVKRNVQKLRGRIEIRSQRGRGSTFLIKLPLTLAIIEGLVVGVGRERYIVPIFAVREIVCVDAESILTVENRAEMALVRGRLLPIVRLSRRFGVESGSAGRLLIVTASAGKAYCLLVDDLIGKQEVVIKSLGETFKNVTGLAGGAILGDGRVGLILDPDAIFGGEDRGPKL